MSFSSLTAGLVREIMRHLDLKEQGRAACVSKLCAAAVLPLAPALAHYVTAGDAPAVRRILLKPDGRLGQPVVRARQDPPAHGGVARQR